MSHPFEDLADAAAEQFPTRAYLVTVTARDTTAGTCSVDPGDGQILEEILYFGPAPAIGAQAVMLTFRRNAVVLGGTG